MTVFFTADEHYGHYTSKDKNIIKYCNRPFSSIEKMDETLINNHNEVVRDQDIVYHLGDFTLGNLDMAESYYQKLNGCHFFLQGSHDRWFWEPRPFIIEKKIQGQHIVMCHYAMRVWARSHYNSWQIYGHSHGQLDPIGKQWDVGMDNNNFYPISFENLKEIMNRQPDNFNLVKEKIKSN